MAKPEDDDRSPGGGDATVALPAVTPSDAQQAALPPRGPIVALRVVGRNEQIDLPLDRDQFTIGAAGPPMVDVALAGAKVSRRHARLTRKGPKLEVLDLGSTNGTFYRGHRDSDFQVAAGDVFECSREVSLMAFDQPLLSLRQRSHWVLGMKAHAAVDAAVHAIASNAPLLLLGPAGCDQVALAQEIHRRSPFGDQPFIVATEVRGEHGTRTITAAQGGTLYLDLAGMSIPPPEAFLVRAFAHCRPIFAASDEVRSAEMLEGFGHRCNPIRLVPPCQRKEDIPRLLNALLWQEHQAKQPDRAAPVIAELGDTNVAGLVAHHWPGHLAEMRVHAPRLYAVIVHRGLRPAARALGISHVTLLRSLNSIGVFVGQRAEGDAKEAEPAEGELPLPPGAPTRPLRVDKGGGEGEGDGNPDGADRDKRADAPGAADKTDGQPPGDDVKAKPDE